MFEVLWKGVKGFLAIVGVFFTLVQGGPAEESVRRLIEDAESFLKSYEGGITA